MTAEVFLQGVISRTGTDTHMQAHPTHPPPFPNTHTHTSLAEADRSSPVISHSDAENSAALLKHNVPDYPHTASSMHRASCNTNASPPAPDIHTTTHTVPLRAVNSQGRTLVPRCSDWRLRGLVVFEDCERERGAVCVCVCVRVDATSCPGL